MLGISRGTRRGAIAKRRASAVTATWNPSDKTAAITLSNANLTAAAGTGQNLVRSTIAITNTKVYYEVTLPGTAASGFEPFIGFCTDAAIASGMYGNGAAGVVVYGTGAIYAWGNTSLTIGTLPANGVVSIALDKANNRAWFRVNGGNWNGSSSNNPATNTGGVDVSSAGSIGANNAFAAFGNNGTSWTVTANFGASAFAYAVPAGFNDTTPPSLPVRYVDNAAAGGGNGQSWATAWNSFASITWSQLSGGGTLYISGGSTSKTYNETLTVGTSGASGSPVLVTRGIDATHTGEPIINSQSARNSGVVVVGRSYVTVSNISSINALDEAFHLRTNTREVIIDTCRVFQPDDPDPGTPRGIDIRNNVTSGGAGTYAVIVRNCTSDTVTSTTGQTDSIWTSANNGVLIEGNTIVMSNGNTTGHSDCWQSFQDINVTVRGNLFSVPNGGGDNHGAWTTDTATGGTLTIYNNVWTRGGGAQSSGLSHWRATQGGSWDGKALIYNNTIYNYSIGLQVNCVAASEAKNNLIHTSSGGLAINLGGLDEPGNVNPTPTAANVNGNLLYAPSGTVAATAQTNRTWAAYQGLGFDVNGVNANPLMTNPAAGDFTLQVGSSALNAGQTVALVTNDRILTSRPQGAAYDIGAYEKV